MHPSRGPCKTHSPTAQCDSTPTPSIVQRKMTLEINAIVILLIALIAPCANVLSLPGVRKLRPGILLARGIPRKGLLMNVNTRTLRAKPKYGMRVGRTPANRLYPGELSDRINVLQPQHSENHSVQILNEVQRTKAAHRKRKWRWRHRHKLTATGISALLFLSTCKARSTVTYSKVSPRSATSCGCRNETHCKSWTVQSLHCRPRIGNSDCWFDCCHLTDAGTAGASSSVETDVECKLFSTSHLGNTAKGPQQPTLSPQVATKDMPQQSICDHCTAPAHMRSAEIDLPPNTIAQALIHVVHMGLSSLQQALQHVVSALNMAMYTLLPTLAASAWLCLSVLATAMSIYTETSRTKKSSKCMQHHLPLQASVILVSLLCMVSTLTTSILTQLHCVLTLAPAYSFLAHPHWTSACLMILYGPVAMQELVAGLTQALVQAIQFAVKQPKQPKFGHPRISNGRYWRRIRNKTRWLHKQFVYKYVKALCWLHQFIQHAKPQQTKYSDTPARNIHVDLKSNDEHCIHKQDNRHRNSQDSNTTRRHKCRNNKDQTSKPIHQHRSAAHGSTYASQYTNKTRRRKAESLQVAVMITAIGGTRSSQEASNMHVNGQFRDHISQDHPTLTVANFGMQHRCQQVNVGTNTKKIGSG